MKFKSKASEEVKQLPGKVKEKPGPGKLCLYAVAAGVGIFVAIELFKLLMVVARGAWICLPYLAAVIILAPAAFILSHLKPMSYERIQEVVRSNAKAYIRRTHRFKHRTPDTYYLLQDSLNAPGEWRRVELPIADFPAGAAYVLKGEKSEWHFLGIEKDSKIVSVCTYELPEGGESFADYDNAATAAECRAVDGFSVLRLIKKPEKAPLFKKPEITAEHKADFDARAAELSEIGVNFYDFICSGIRFTNVLFSMSPKFQVSGCTVSEIVDEVGVTRLMDLKLHLKYHWFGKLLRLFKKAWVQIAAVILLLVMFLLVGMYVKPAAEPAPDQPEETELVTEETAEDTPIEEPAAEEPAEPVDEPEETATEAAEETTDEPAEASTSAEEEPPAAVGEPEAENDAEVAASGAASEPAATEEIGNET